MSKIPGIGAVPLPDTARMRCCSAPPMSQPEAAGDAEGVGNPVTPVGIAPGNPSLVILVHSRKKEEHNPQDRKTAGVAPRRSGVLRTGAAPRAGNQISEEGVLTEMEEFVEMTGPEAGQAYTGPGGEGHHEQGIQDSQQAVRFRRSSHRRVPHDDGRPPR